jgi:transposase-like protein
LSRKVKYSKELKLSVVQKYLNGEGSSPSLAKEIGTTNTIILRWVNKYKSFGENAFNVSYSNAAYTKEFKKQVVLDYLNGEGSYTDLMVKYNIPANSTIEKWVKDYNSYIELKDYIPGGKEIYMAKSRKVSKDERIEIAKYCIEHNLDYVGTAKFYETTYANVFNWVKKYRENGEEGLNDNRGRKKLVEEDNSEVAILKRQLKQMERERNRALLEVELLKKLDEIERRRFIERVNMKENMKQSKK